MAEDQGSKTEQPSARRLSKAREEGQVPKSVEINTCVVLLASIFTLYFTGPDLYRRMTVNLSRTLAQVAQISIEGPDGLRFLTDQLWDMAGMVAPMFIVIPLLGVLSNVVQIGGPMFTTNPLMPKLSKLNPIAGFSKMFSLRSLTELAKSILKIVIIGATAYYTVKGEMSHIVLLVDVTPIRIGYYVLAVSFEIFLKTCWALLALAILDFAFQRWQFMRDMKMTKQEVKEEMKQSEGDPLIKSRLRALQRDMARKRMMSRVPEADVVVTNPTHLAVALLYDPTQSEAPMVVAKGQNLIAEKIKEIAREHGIPVTEDKPLARALYKNVEVGQTIPVLFYQAVAEILSYVYRLKGRKVHGRTGRHQ